MKSLVVLISALLLSACNRADNYLPSLSNDGANTAGWMVQDFAYKQANSLSLSDQQSSTAASIQIHEEAVSGSIYVHATSAFDTSPEYRKGRQALANDRLHIYLDHIPKKIGVYSCKDGVRFHYEKIVEDTVRLTYLANDDPLGALEITCIDWNKKIIAGTFSFNATLEENPADPHNFNADKNKLSTLAVAKGRFDLSF